MLFPYRYIPHQMERMQEFVDYIFYAVWCEALRNRYDISLFNKNPELKEMIEGLHFTEPKGAEFFIIGIQQIFNHFKQFNCIDVILIRRWYEINNAIESVCCGSCQLPPIKYADLSTCYNGRYHPLSQALESFFKDLYSSNFLKLKIVSDIIGTIDDHYQCFMASNTKGKCPFCGIGDIKGIYYTRREAYDHYLPKGLYPFNSINFRNLAPACHECNSTYKLTKDPVHSKKGTRKAFYPYSNQEYHIDITIDLKSPDIDYLTPKDITLACGPESINEEIETWKDLYGIEERYKAKCCNESDGKYWLTQIMDEWKEDDRSPQDFLKVLKRHTKKNPYADCNFLKKAFLEGCERKGLFS